MKYEVYILSFSIVGLSIFGQVVLWFGQAKYTLYLSEGTSELKRKFLALSTCMVYSVDDRIFFLRNLPGLISVGKQRAQAALFF